MDLKSELGSNTRLVLPKNIQNVVPLSNKVDARTFSRLLD